MIKLKIKFIGTGDAFTKHGHNSAIIELEHTNLMIDCPDSNYTKTNYADVENIFITHLHADHINGLEKFAYFKKYATPNTKKTGLYVPKAIKNNLWDSLKHGLGTTTEGNKELEDYFNVFEIEKTFELDGQRFEIFETKHVPGMKSFGLWAKNYFYYSGDSLVDNSLLEKIEKETKIIFHDCHLWDLNIASHASLDDIKKLKENIKKKIILMHYRDGFQDKKEVEGFLLAKTDETYEVKI